MKKILILLLCLLCLTACQNKITTVIMVNASPKSQNDAVEIVNGAKINDVDSLKVR